MQLGRCGRLFVTPWTVACQAPLSTGIFRHGYWSGLLFPPPGDLPNLKRGAHEVLRSAGWVKERNETKKTRFHELLETETRMAVMGSWVWGKRRCWLEL